MALSSTMAGGAALALAALLAALAATRSAVSPPTSSPVLLVRAVAGDPATHVRDTREAFAARLALGSLPARERVRVRDVFDEASTRLEAQANPLDIDFGDGDPLAELEGRLQPWAASFGAASALAARRRRVPDLEVRAAASCADAKPGERCITRDIPDDDPVVRRARLAAWATASIVRREHASVAVRDRVADCLRERTLDPNASIALVVTSVHPHLDAELEASGRRLARAVAATGREATDGAVTRMLEEVAPTDEIEGLSSMTTTELVVVPKLSAVFARSTVEREVDACSE